MAELPQMIRIEDKAPESPLIPTLEWHKHRKLANAQEASSQNSEKLPDRRTKTSWPSAQLRRTDFAPVEPLSTPAE